MGQEPEGLRIAPLGGFDAEIATDGFWGTQLSVPWTICCEHAGGDEQRDPAADPPLRDDLVHQEDEVAAEDELGDDDGVREQEAVPGGERAEGRDERARRREVPVDLGDRFDEDHRNDDDLLRPLVDPFVLVVGEVEVDDLRAGEQLHDDRPGDDRADPEVHERALRPGQDRTVACEQVDDGRLVDAEEVDVGQQEVHRQDPERPEQLRPEMDVALRLGDRGHPRRQRLQAGTVSSGSRCPRGRDRRG